VKNEDLTLFPLSNEGAEEAIETADRFIQKGLEIIETASKNVR